jgi:tritrans,polycis-undecaprenyl-diphosphate synthase [geranylgeranyl-diphosphate specific]
MGESNVPKHIGIIMDGNRRFSRRLMLKPWKGHEWGAEKVTLLLEWCEEYGIHEITLYTFSVQNFNRPKEEFSYLMDIFRKNFDNLMVDPRVEKMGLRINIIGRTWMFPLDIQQKMQAVMELTRGHKNHVLNLAMAYGGREEVIDATKKIIEQVQSGQLNIDEINEETFSRNLYFRDEPDLIIRTGGERRTSNFLAFQSAYSEWIFLDKMWPEFEKDDLKSAIDEYTQRERRFGH